VSKLNTALQIGLIGLVLASLGLGLAVPRLTVVLVYAVAATTMISGAGYLIRWTRALAGVSGGP